LRSFEEQLDQFKSRGVQIVAISVDPAPITRDLCQKQGYTYTFLSDEKLDVIRSFDLLHDEGGPHGSDIARPGEFLIDSTGTIRWVNLTEDLRVRARPEQILTVLDQLGRKASSGD
jgi:peroxiredoxin